MLTLTAVTPEGKETELKYVETLVLQKDFNVPADSMSFVVRGVMEEDVALVILKENDREVYRGIVDEQNIYISQKEQTEFVSRSMEGVLLDNEACPATFSYPDAELMISRYLAPLGIGKFVGENRIHPGEFKVKKGTSCWEVMSEFCKGVYALTPVVRGDTFVLRDRCGDGELEFSVNGENPPVSLQYRCLRYKPLSRVRVRTPESAGYTSVVADEDSLREGIVRERYLDVAYDSSGGLQKADRLIRGARAEAQTVKLRIDGRVLADTGTSARITGTDMDLPEAMYISSLRYVLSGTSEYTDITLKKKEN